MEPGRCPICSRLMDFSIEYYHGMPHILYSCPQHGIPDYDTYVTTAATNAYEAICPICGRRMMYHIQYNSSVPNGWWGCPVHGSPIITYRYSTGTEPGVLYQWYRGSKSGESPPMPYSYTVDYAHHETTTNPNTNSITTITW